VAVAADNSGAEARRRAVRRISIFIQFSDCGADSKRMRRAKCHGFAKSPRGGKSRKQKAEI
jgi:hypothetical protein